jgi:hypothetical protein
MAVRSNIQIAERCGVAERRQCFVFPKTPTHRGTNAAVRVVYTRIDGYQPTCL